MVTSPVAAVTAFGVRARNPACHELRCRIASAQLRRVSSERQQPELERQALDVADCEKFSNR